MFVHPVDDRRSGGLLRVAGQDDTFPLIGPLALLHGQNELRPVPADLSPAWGGASPSTMTQTLGIMAVL